MALFLKFLEETTNPTICILHPLAMMHACSLCNSIELPYIQLTLNMLQEKNLSTTAILSESDSIEQRNNCMLR